jgi:tetratricopeptide (TPR) repeat protein
MKHSDKILLLTICLLAAALRISPVFSTTGAWHPDEYSYVFWPLNFFSGDLNPHFFTYPSLHYYVLGLVYGLLYLLSSAPSTLQEYIAYHYFWNPDFILQAARTTSVIFASCTTIWVALLGWRAYGREAGLLAGLLLAICTLHTRQSSLASVDISMTFWALAALWATVRLLEHCQYKDYALAGIFIGLACSSKYPGAAISVAVLSAHLLARRSPLDTRLWLAAGTTIIVFCATSPYIVLDFDSFKTYFLDQIDHVKSGRGTTRAWWYHIEVSLRYSLGWPALLLIPVSFLYAWRTKNRAALVVISGFISFYVAISWGNLAFVRYALPVMAIQSVLCAGTLCLTRQRKWRIVIAIALTALPLYDTLNLTRLLSHGDTRSEARQWIESQIPPLSTLCTFGGWAGDVQLRTLGDLAWKIKYYENSFGRDQLTNQLPFLETHYTAGPFYRYALQEDSREGYSNPIEMLNTEGCTHVVLHQHPLGYSSVDTSLIQHLNQRAKLIAAWQPTGLWQSPLSYDVNDAYYVPLDKFGNLSQAGPEIQIWQLHPSTTQIPHTGPRALLSRAYAMLSGRMLVERQFTPALATAHQALRIDPDNLTSMETLAQIYMKMQQFQKAEQVYLSILRKTPQSSSAHSLFAEFLAETGRVEQALRSYERAIELDPENSIASNNIGVLYRSLGDFERAITSWIKTLKTNPKFIDALFNLGTAYYLNSQNVAAAQLLQELVNLAPNHLKGHNSLAATYVKLGEQDQAILHWKKVIELAPDNADAHYNIAKTYQYELADPERAIASWQRAIELRPNAADAYIHLANAYGKLGRNDDSKHHFSQIIARFPTHSQADEIRRLLKDNP